MARTKHVLATRTATSRLAAKTSKPRQDTLLGRRMARAQAELELLKINPNASLRQLKAVGDAAVKETPCA